MGSIPGSGRSPGEGNGNPLQYSCLENSMGRGAWRATVHGVAESWTRLSNFAHMCSSPFSFTLGSSGGLLSQTVEFQVTLRSGEDALGWLVLGGTHTFMHWSFTEPLGQVRNSTKLRSCRDSKTSPLFLKSCLLGTQTSVVDLKGFCY